MDTRDFAEGDYVTAELVKNSVTKKLVIVDEAKGVPTKFGDRLECTVSIDGKLKKWKLNQASVKNMHQISTDSKFWVSRAVQLMVEKDKVIGTPILDQVVSSVPLPSTIVQA